MAFTDDDGGSGRFVKIIDGSLVEKAPSEKNGVEIAPPNEKYELFVTKNPETEAVVQYYIRRYKRISGKVESLERVEITASKIYGYNLHMSDEDGNFSIFFKDDAKVTDRLLKVFENIDLNEELTVSVWKDVDGRPAITFQQNEQNVSQAWSGGVVDGKWEGNLPAPKKSKGKWDYSPISEFLYNNAMENIIPQFVKTGGTEEAAQAASAGTETAVGKDNIPF